MIYLPYFFFHLLIPFPRVPPPTPLTMLDACTYNISWLSTLYWVGGASFLSDAYNVEFLWMMSCTILSWIEARKTGTGFLENNYLGIEWNCFPACSIDKLLFRCPVAKRVSHIGLELLSYFIYCVIKLSSQVCG